MSIADRRAAFNALVTCYHNSFENVKEGATKHSPLFIRKALLSEAGRAALSLDPRLTSTNAGAVAVGIARNVLTSEKAARAFIDVEISEGAFIVSFDNTVNADAAYGICQLSGTAAVLCKSGDKIGEGLTSDLLILAVEPTQAVAEGLIAAEKGRVDESKEPYDAEKEFAQDDPRDRQLHHLELDSDTENKLRKANVKRVSHVRNFSDKTLRLHGVSDDGISAIDRGIAKLGIPARRRVDENAASHLGVRISTIVTDHLGPDSVSHLHRLAARHGGKVGDEYKHAGPGGERVVNVHVPSSSQEAFGKDWNSHVTDKIEADRSAGKKSKLTLGHYSIPESTLSESLHNDVTKSLSHAGMDGSKLFHAPGEGWSALHGALAKHGLVIHDDSFTGDHSTHHRGVYQLAKPSEKPSEGPKPVEGAYLHVHRTAGVGDGKGVDGSDHPIQGKHEFNTYLTGKKLKESTVSDNLDEATYGSHSSADGRFRVTVHHKAETNEYVAKAHLDGKHHEGATGYHGYSLGDKESRKGALEDAQSSAKAAVAHYEKHGAKSLGESTLQVTEAALQGALTKADISTLHAFVHEGKVTEFAEKGNRTTVSFTHKVPGADVANLHKALGGHEAFGHMIDGSSHNHTTGEHRFTAYGKGHAERAGQFAAHVKEKLGVEPKVDDRSVHMSESTAKQKLQALLRVFAMPGSRTVKEADGFDAVLAKVLARTTKAFKRTSYGMLSESDEQFAQVVDEVCEALATEVPKAEMERRFISESAAITGDTLNESVMQKADVYAPHLQAVTRAILLGNGFACPAVDAALTKWASANA